MLRGFQPRFQPTGFQPVVVESKDSKAILSVSGIYTDEPLEWEFSEKYRGGLPNDPGKVVTYKKLKGNWFVVSGYKNQNVFYEKRYLIKDQLIGFEMTYPESEKSLWEPILSQIIAGFKPTDEITQNETQ